MLNSIDVALPVVHMAGSDAHFGDARVEVGQFGFAVFLAPDAQYPILDVNGTPEQLAVVVRGLQAALATQSAARHADTGRIAPMKPQCAVTEAGRPTVR
jgi:hypothetical protein